VFAINLRLIQRGSLLVSPVSGAYPAGFPPATAFVAFFYLGGLSPFF